MTLAPLLSTHTRRGPKPRASCLDGDEFKYDLDKLLKLLSFAEADTEDNEHRFQQKFILAGKKACTTMDESGALYVVRIGTLKTEGVDCFGSSYVVSFPRPGDILGIETVTGVQFVLTTTTITDVSLIVIPKELISVLMRECDAFAQGLYNVLGKYLKAARERIHSQTKLKAPARVAEFLIAELDRQAGNNGNSISLPMKRGDIASFLGITLETLCRSMGEFEADGLISRSQRFVKVCNRKGLEQRSLLTKLY